MLNTIRSSASTLINMNISYVNKLSIGAALAANRTTKVIRRFTAVATISYPMSLLTQVWSMNVKIPGSESNYGWFIGLSILITICMIIQIIFFRSKRWI